MQDLPNIIFKEAISNLKKVAMRTGTVKELYGVDRSKFYPQGMRGFAGMNFSPIPAKKHSPSSSSVTSNDQREWAREKKAFNALSLADYAEYTEKA